MSRQVKRISKDSPWPGLMSFGEGDVAFFKGRDEESAELARLVDRDILTSLFGKSGLGKTSLLQAGLFPILRERNYLPVYLRLDLAEKAPSLTTQIFQRLLAETAHCNVECPAPYKVDSLWTFFNRHRTLLWKGARPVVPILVFDQFEEIFSLGRASTAKVNDIQSFVEQLACLIEGTLPPDVAKDFETERLDPTEFEPRRRNFRIVLSFREDYLPEFEDLKTRIPSLFRSRLRLLRFTQERAHKVIDQVAGHLFEPGAIDTLVQYLSQADVAKAEDRRPYRHQDIEPALLSLLCDKVNERRIKARLARISSSSFAASSGGILRDFYRDATRQVSVEVLRFLEHRLIADGDVRVPFPLDAALNEVGVSMSAIEQLVTSRILRIDAGSDVNRVELVHDLLIPVVRQAEITRQTKIKKANLRAVLKKARGSTLLLQGGGIRAAYQAGVYEAIASTKFTPDWIVASSAGAITAAIIAGNAPERRIDSLREFWRLISVGRTSSNQPTLYSTPTPAALGIALSNLLSSSSLHRVHNIANAELSTQDLPSSAQSTLEVNEIRDLITQLVDFDRLNFGSIRVAICAVNVVTGNFTVFDNSRMCLEMNHILAGCSLPLVSPPVIIDGQAYWDGSVIAQTPLNVVLSDNNRSERLLVISVDLFGNARRLPTNLSQVLVRENEIAKTSRMRADLDRTMQLFNVRSALQNLGLELPAALRERPDIQQLLEWADFGKVDIVRLTLNTDLYEPATGRDESCQTQINNYWETGHRDMRDCFSFADEALMSTEATGLRVHDRNRIAT